jgi:CDP-diacylglycerol--glycerol-3-phosphate 3-phosphatidyltransferase
MLEHLRKVLTAIVQWPGRFLVKHHVSPNTVTITGTVLFAAAAIATVPWGFHFVGAWVIAVVALTDGIDGYMARATKPTVFGAFLDSTLDRVADGALAACLAVWFARRGSAAGLVWDGPSAAWIADTRTLWVAVALVALVGGQVIPYARARAESVGLVGTGGPLGRTDRTALTCFGLGFAGLGVPYALEVAVTLIAVLAVVTSVLRIRKAWRSGQPSPPDA